jgi:hypothetical protein
LEIWTRENLRPQPTSVADHAKRWRVIPNRADDEGALNRGIHSRAMRDPSVRAGLALSTRLRKTPCERRAAPRLTRSRRESPALLSPFAQTRRA